MISFMLMNKKNEVNLMKIIKINTLVNSCMSARGGKMLRGLLEREFDISDNIILDFEGIVLFASPFFNISIGYIIKKYGIDLFNRKVEFINISQLGINTIEQVKNNTLKYQDNPEEISKIVDNTEN